MLTITPCIALTSVVADTTMLSLCVEHQVLNKLLALSSAASQQKLVLGTWSNMLISTSSFLKIIYTVTGKDILPFIEQWVQQIGCARYSLIGVFVCVKCSPQTRLFRSSLISRISLIHTHKHTNAHAHTHTYTQTCTQCRHSEANADMHS